MRVVDANWIGLKLKKLLNFGEQNGEFWVPMPGAEWSTQYPSTVACIANPAAASLQGAGILDDEGRAIQSAGILALPDAVKLIDHESGADQGQGVPKLQRGRDDQV